VLENGNRWRMVGAGEWQSLEDGRRWRLGGAGDWEALESLEFCQAATDTNFSTRLQQWPTDEL
jgi:hypothetical protein